MTPLRPPHHPTPEAERNYINKYYYMKKDHEQGSRCDIEFAIARTS
jgi:hypothetical protein